MPNVKDVQIDRIYALAEKQGISLAFLCTAVDKDRLFITRVRRGKDYVDDHELSIIAEKLHTTVNYLTGKTENAEIPQLEPPQQDVRIKDICNLLYTLTDEELCAVQAFVCGIIAGRT